MTLPLTAEDRTPRDGDVLQRRGHVITVQSHCRAMGLDFFLVNDERGVSRMGRRHMLGDTGLSVMRKDGVWRPWCPGPYVYRERADGGRVDWPIDAGAYIDHPIADARPR